MKSFHLPIPISVFISFIFLSSLGLLYFFISIKQRVEAVAPGGTLNIAAPVTLSSNNLTAGKFIDNANSAYFLQPAATGNSLLVAGNVGIGTTAPGTALSVNGVISASTNTNLRLQAGGTGTGSTGTGSIYFLNSSGASAGRFDTTNTLSPYGTGADGACTISSGTTNLASSSCSGRSTADAIATSITATVSQGSTSVSVGSCTGISSNDEVFLIQMATSGSASGGSYERRFVSSCSATTLTLTSATSNAYASSNAQVVRVPNYTTVSITGTMTTNAWSGSTGGVLIFRASQSVTVNSGGIISGNGLGFGGGASVNGGAGAIVSSGEYYGCNTAAVAGSTGTTGSGSGGGSGGSVGGNPGGCGSYSSNDGGYTFWAGGGGGGGSSGGGGGGGSYGGAGAAGSAGTSGAGGNGGCGDPRGASYCMGAGGTGGTGTGGSTGSTYGNSNLTSLFLGSGGGGGASGAGGGTGSPRGGAGQNGGAGGAGGVGGTGGGIIYIGSPTISNSGTISAKGNIGSNGSAGSSGTSPGTGGGNGGGSGGGGGGGGAGGSIFIQANSATLGTMTASGNSGGNGNNGGAGTASGSSNGGGGGGAGVSGGGGGSGNANGSTGANAAPGSGGTGGNGLIRVESSTINGSSSPTAFTSSTWGNSPLAFNSTSYGTLYLGSTNTASADLAEYYVAGDSSIAAGDVVVISDSTVRGVNSATSEEEIVYTKGVLRKAEKAYDSKLIGIISTNPGVLMGSIDGDSGKADKRMLALSGRVPVKIAPDSPAIAIGDFLTSSATYPGMAIKATHPGYVVARALEAWISRSGVSHIDAFVEPSYYVGDLDANGNIASFTVGTLQVTNLIEGNSNIRGQVSLDPGMDSVSITKYWTAPPVSIQATPSYNTTVFVEDISKNGFTIHVGTPPTQKQTLYWQVMW